ncbi:MAG: 50S ribosome-binding GTPase [Planctomycetota bacterium]|nr:50S ribosome-binding GTPase [Planctomycetota bacterium]
MAASKQDVIAAPATPTGAAARAVIRLTGPSLLADATRYLSFLEAPLAARPQVVDCILEPLPGIRLDAHLLVFAGPHSATGEDVIEIHMPGAPPLVEAQLQQLLSAGARLSEAGEFTRRAFLNGRLDLTQAEAVLELVEARSSAAAMAASEVLGGSLGGCMSASRDVLLEALMELEAGLDFEEGDSQDLEPGAVDELLHRASVLLNSGLQAEQQRLLRHGGQFRIALMGAANAGKSTLFSRLTATQSLISDTAGTTRDRREAIWQVPGLELPLTLIDFPGLGGEAADSRDAAARELAELNSTPLDLLWLCVAADTAVEDLPARLPAAPVIVLWTQFDRQSSPNRALLTAVHRLVGAEAPQLELSCPPDNLQVLPSEALARLSQDVLTDSEKALSDHIAHGRRHQEALQEAVEAVARATQWDQLGGHQDLVAEDLRAALSALALLVGEFTSEDVLDRLFSAFCVGK